MTYASTITSKGQVLIPKEIRDLVGIKSRDRILFELTDSWLRIKPVPTIDQMFGSIKAAKVLSRDEQKVTIRGRVLNKFKQKV